MNIKRDYLYDEMYKLADTVIHIEEVDVEDEYKNECFKVSLSHMKEFFKQFNKRLSACKNDAEIVFTKEATLNFIIFSLKKLIVDYDCPDENIEFLAEHIRNQILKAKRSENNV